MSVVGMQDAEATSRRPCAPHGDDVLVSTSMDLHGNVSEVLRDAWICSPATGWRRTRTG
jgi:microcystin degradation protein MlrC